MIFEKEKNEKIYLWLVIALAVDVALWIFIFINFQADKMAAPRLSFLDVGQGDSSLIELPGGVQVIIDGGPSGKRLMESLEQILPPQDRYIDLVVMTHPQLDHFGGFIDLIKNYKIGLFIGNGRVAEIAAYPDLIDTLKKYNVPYLQLREGDRMRIGDTDLTLLAPSADNVLSSELNDTGIVMLLDSPQVKSLYVADIGFGVEEEILKKYNLDVDVLKVAHHGSRFSTSKDFLAEVAPAVAVIQVGSGNTYGHPTKEALSRLTKEGARIMRTDKDGIIQILPTEKGFAIFTKAR